MARENGSPEDNACSEELGDGKALDEPVDGVFDDQNGNVDTRGQPGELLSVETEVLAQAHDGSEGSEGN